MVLYMTKQLELAGVHSRATVASIRGSYPTDYGEARQAQDVSTNALNTT